MARRPNVARASLRTGPDGPALVARICEAFRQRIGNERYAVWFGDAASLTVSPSSTRAGDPGAADPCVTVQIGSGFTHEWLRKTFREDLEAVVREACGPAASLVWREVAPEPEETLADQPKEAAQPARAMTRRAGKTGPRTMHGPADPARRADGAVVPPLAEQPPASRRPAAALDAFVVGASNRMAYAAVELAVDRPGEMSPLFLHGSSGVGKTHLLEAFCTQARERHPTIAAVFLSAEQFTTSFLQALHGSGLPGFRRSCRHADLLVVDDLQFFIGKRATIVEFQQTIDALTRQGKQMVFAADRDLDALAELGPDLLVRLKGGMHARILPPDEPVRRGIVAGLAARRGLAIPADVIDYVARHITRHARELVGAINRLEATSHMLGLPISLGMAEETLADLVRSSARGVRLADIERAVCSAFGIESGSLQSSRRTRNVSQPRMLAMFLARKHTSAPLTEIGGYFGRRSHSTVITAQKTVAEWVSQHENIVLADASWDAAEAIRRVEDLLRVG